MTKRYLLALLLLFLLQNKVFSQIKISGQIKDEKNNPVEFIEIQLQNKDSIIFKSELTNAEGKFILETEKGEYSLLVRQLGVIYHKQKISVNQDTYIGIINITDKTQQLQEVVITSKKKLIERKVDRLVFNVDNSVSASGGDALDALSLTPSVRVLNDKISIVGKGNVMVMVNDRIMQLAGEDLTNYLKSLRSDDIKSIEVITNPPAKYSAEGNSGILNIVLKRTVSNTWKSDISTVYRQYTYPIGSLGGSFMYKKDKINISSNLNYINGSNAPQETMKIDYPNQIWDEINNSRNYSNNLSGILNFDYAISKKIKAGISLNFSKGKPTSKETSETLLINKASNKLDSLIVSNIKNINRNEFIASSFYTIYKIDTLGKKISFDFDFFKQLNYTKRDFTSNNYLQNNIYINNSYYKGNNTGNQNLSNFSINIDMEHPLKKMFLNYGGRFSFSETNNELNFYNISSGIPILNNLLSNTFLYKENVQALYFSIEKKINEKWDTKLGLRYENTETSGISLTLNQVNKFNYSKLFPTFYLSYKANDNNSFNFNYGRRINRPNFNALNPFRVYSNIYSYSEGNPFIQPSFSNNFEINYIYKDNLSFQLYYSKLIDGWQQVTFANPNDLSIRYTKYENFITDNSFGANINYTYNAFKWWEMVYSFDYGLSESTSSLSVTQSNLKGSNAYLNTSNTFKINENTNFSIFYWQFFGGVSQLDYMKNRSQLNLTLQRKFLNKKMIITVTGFDVFRSNYNHITSYSNNLKIIYNNYYDQRSFRIAILYKFGNKNIDNNNRAQKNEEEKNRAN